VFISQFNVKVIGDLKKEGGTERNLKVETIYSANCHCKYSWGLRGLTSIGYTTPKCGQRS